ncbi:MAG: hypothetical protein QXO69_03325 [archaeon]
MVRRGPLSEKEKKMKELREKRKGKEAFKKETFLETRESMKRLVKEAREGKLAVGKLEEEQLRAQAAARSVSKKEKEMLSELAALRNRYKSLIEDTTRIATKEGPDRLQAMALRTRFITDLEEVNKRIKDILERGKK